MASRKLQVEIIGDASSLERAFGRSARSADTFGTKLGKAGKVAALGFVGGVAAAGYAAKGFVEKALEAERAQSRLDAAFRATRASSGQQAAAMARVASVSKQAALDDEDLMDSLGRLARATGSTAKAQQQLATVADIARGRGISLEAATQIQIKANLGQLGALKRLGIEIPKVTTAQDALKDAGGKVTASAMAAAKAQDEQATRASAVAALQRQFAGDAVRYGESNAAAGERAKVAWENLQETLGARLAPAFASAANGAAVFLNRMAESKKVQEVLTQVGQAISSVAAFISREWPRVSAAAAQVVAYYKGTVEPAIRNVVNALLALWAKFGAQLTAIFQNAWRGTKAVIDGVLAVLRGDWGKAWESLKTIVSASLKNVVLVLQLAVSLVKAAAIKLGTAIVTGVVDMLKSLAGKVTEKLGDVRTAIVNAAQAAYGNALGIGKAIVQGVLDGITSLPGRLADKLGGMVSGAISAAGRVLHGSGPWQATIHTVGKPLAEGVIIGVEQGLVPLAAALATKVSSAASAAASAVTNAQSAYRSAWDGYTGQALAAFDEMATKLKTKSERALEALSGKSLVLDKKQAAHDVSSTGSELDSAKLGARGALVAGDPEVLKAANEKLFQAQMAHDRAVLAQQQLTLGEKAAKERAAQDEQTAVDRIRFETWLATRSTQQQRALMKEGEGQRAIVAKIRSFDNDYKAAGAKLGNALAIGLESAAQAVAKAAKKLMEEAAKYTNAAGAAGRTASDNAKAGKAIEARAAGGPVSRNVPYWVGERGPEVFVPGSSGTIVPSSGPSASGRGVGGGVSVTVNAPNYVGTREELIRVVQDGLIQLGRRTGGNVLGGMA